jgi:hypothetical protein
LSKPSAQNHVSRLTRVRFVGLNRSVAVGRSIFPIAPDYHLGKAHCSYPFAAPAAPSVRADKRHLSAERVSLIVKMVGAAAFAVSGGDAAFLTP